MAQLLSSNVTGTLNVSQNTAISGNLSVSRSISTNGNVIVSNVGGLYFGANNANIAVSTSKVSMAYNVATQSLDIVYLG